MITHKKLTEHTDGILNITKTNIHCSSRCRSRRDRKLDRKGEQCNNRKRSSFCGYSKKLLPTYPAVENSGKNPKFAFIFHFTEGKGVKVPSESWCKWVSTASRRPHGTKQIDVHEFLESS